MSERSLVNDSQQINQLYCCYCIACCTEHLYCVYQMEPVSHIPDKYFYIVFQRKSRQCHARASRASCGTLEIPAVLPPFLVQEISSLFHVLVIIASSRHSLTALHLLFFSLSLSLYCLCLSSLEIGSKNVKKIIPLTDLSLSLRHSAQPICRVAH